MDESDFLYGKDIAIYQMLIGSAQWAVRLGRFDIQYATNTLARYGTKPRVGHYERALRIFGYLKHNTKARILFNAADFDLDCVEFEKHDWTDLYPGAKEAMPEDMPKPKTRKVQITAILDASHATDLETRRSVTGYLLFVGMTPVKWYSKRQNTVESSTYGSELVAMRVAVEAVLELRYKLRMMGIQIEDTTNVLSDNQAVVINTQFPSSNLKKKHNAVAYHKCREAVAAGIVRTGHIPSKDNIADILTKPKGGSDYYRLLRGLLYGRWDDPDEPPVHLKGSSRSYGPAGSKVKRMAVDGQPKRVQRGKRGGRGIESFQSRAGTGVLSPTGTSG